MQKEPQAGLFYAVYSLRCSLSRWEGERCKPASGAATRQWLSLVRGERTQRSSWGTWRGELPEGLSDPLEWVHVPVFHPHGPVEVGTGRSAAGSDCTQHRASWDGLADLDHQSVEMVVAAEDPLPVVQDDHPPSNRRLPSPPDLSRRGCPHRPSSRAGQVKCQVPRPLLTSAEPPDCPEVGGHSTRDRHLKWTLPELIGGALLKNRQDPSVFFREETAIQKALAIRGKPDGLTWIPRCSNIEALPEDAPPTVPIQSDDGNPESSCGRGYGHGEQCPIRSATGIEAQRMGPRPSPHAQEGIGAKNEDGGDLAGLKRAGPQD